MNRTTSPIRRTLEQLEARENPSVTWAGESFEGIAAPKLPTDWATWSNDGEPQFITSKLTALSGTNSLASLGSASNSSRLWNRATYPGDYGAALSLRAGAAIRMDVLARGSQLDSTRPSYLAAEFSGARSLELLEVRDGIARSLGRVNSVESVSGKWLRIALRPVGEWAGVSVQRIDTGAYLKSDGTWQAAEVEAIRVKTTLPSGEGAIGLGRRAGASGMAFVDDFAVLAPPGVNEAFDTTIPSKLPENWNSWSNNQPKAFGVGTGRVLSPTQSLASNGLSTTLSRAWLGSAIAADAGASVSVYADNLIPSGVFIRGSQLDTARPTYYSLSVTRGLKVQLNRVVDGTETVLATLRSTEYVSGKWIRLTLVAEGNKLRALVVRTDTNQWLDADGTWGANPEQALEVSDSQIAGGGFVGVERGRLVAGPVWFDDFAIRPAKSVGPALTLSASQSGPLFTGVVSFLASTPPGTVNRLEFRREGIVRANEIGSSLRYTLDTGTLTNGRHEVTARAIDRDGNSSTQTIIFNVFNENTPTPSRPTGVKKYTHIRLAQLAYSGNPAGTFELNLAKNSLDLIIPNPRYLQAFENASPDTTKVVYTNLSNVYGSLLTDWNAYADANRTSREQAFYHVAQATDFTGASPSSLPVTYFWNVQRIDGVPTDLTVEARGTREKGVPLGGAGTSLVLGYVERFRELSFKFTKAAQAGWSGVLEYVSAVNADGSPAAWKTLSVLQDGTGGYRTNGAITFDPPADWVSSKVAGGTQQLHQLRVRTLGGSASQAPEARSILGRDYVQANGRAAGVIPAFDTEADKNRDGYLSDGEYENRRSGFDARFEYESRLFYPYYGQMRFAVNPTSIAVKQWFTEYNVRSLQQNPLADGLFIDNSHGKLPFKGTPVKESVDAFTQDYAALVASITRAVAPKWTVSNTAGSIAEGDPVAKASTAVLEEFVLRPNNSNWAQVRDVAELIARRLNADSPSPYVILDSHSGKLATNDPRSQMGTLAYYYLLADPDKTFLMFNGGQAPAVAWNQVWVPAAAVDVGKPVGAYTTWDTGLDPENARLTYKVLRREYQNAITVFKPLSYKLATGTGTSSDATATTHALGGDFRRLNADGSLGPVVTSISLRGGEGAVLMRA